MKPQRKIRIVYADMWISAYAEKTHVKNQPGTMKDHENQPESIKNQPGTMKNHPETMKIHDSRYNSINAFDDSSIILLSSNEHFG